MIPFMTQFWPKNPLFHFPCYLNFTSYRASRPIRFCIMWVLLKKDLCFSLTETENRIQNLKLARLWLKFYSWYCTFRGVHFYKFFNKPSYINAAISKNWGIFWQFFWQINSSKVYLTSCKVWFLFSLERSHEKMIRWLHKKEFLLFMNWMD